MNTLTIENVRCFKGRHIIPLAPLTILVGENSTGKTTLMALVRTAWDIASHIGVPDFNEPPFKLGTYDRIAHYHGGQGKRAPSFALGFGVTVPRKPLRRSQVANDRTSRSASVTIHVEQRFVPHEGRPELSEWTVDVGSHRVEMKKGESPDSGVLSINVDGNEVIIRGTEKNPLPGPLAGVRLMEHLGIMVEFRAQEPDKKWTFDGTLLPEHIALLNEISAALNELKMSQRPFAMAPIRSEPDWIYEIGSERPTPEGGHAPAALSRLMDSSSASSKDTLKVISEFGSTAGLFEALDVKKLGTQPKSDAFQILVQIGDQPRESNLVDVGYGVSQALPILVETLATSSSFLLIQQPEVHLHPRAQAALGTLFARCVRDYGRRFVVETHSDYLLDRLCMEVREKNVLPEQIRIIYLEQDKQGKTKTFPLTIDIEGNINDAPPSYRRFFLDEQRRYLGR